MSDKKKPEETPYVQTVKTEPVSVVIGAKGNYKLPKVKRSANTNR